jgi:hypothetical protein
MMWVGETSGPRGWKAGHLAQKLIRMTFLRAIVSPAVLGTASVVQLFVFASLHARFINRTGQTLTLFPGAHQLIRGNYGSVVSVHLLG